MERGRRLAAAGALVVLVAGLAAWWTIAADRAPARKNMASRTEAASKPGLETITVGGGCFWCMEAVFDELEGVVAVESGYSGGKVANPTYRQVCGGETGHAEVVQIVFDPKKVSLHDLLTVFFTLHDPTTRNAQGNDVGTQYRSIILTRTPAQAEEARKVLHEIVAERLWGEASIVTEIVPFEEFWPAEDYHQDYYANNSSQPYCRVVIDPKVAKLRQKFAAKLKKKPGS